MTIDYLDLPGWKTLGKHTEGGDEVIEAEYTTHPEACQRCGVIGRLYRHGTKTVTYRDTPNRTGPAVIQVKVQRYRCRDCSETFLQPLGGIEEARRMTTRCADYIRARWCATSSAR